VNTSNLKNAVFGKVIDELKTQFAAAEAELVHFDGLASQARIMERNLAELHSQAEKAKTAAAESNSRRAEVERALTEAERATKKLVADAQAKADGIIADAKDKAADLLQLTEDECTARKAASVAASKRNAIA
jgi:hypothetical protein